MPDSTAAPARSGYTILLLRFLPDGKLDPSFGTGGRVWTDLVTLDTPLQGAGTGDVALGSSSATAVALQPDGKIVVGGSTQSGASTAFAVLRYLPDGHPDEAFGSGGLVVTEQVFNLNGIGKLFVEAVTRADYTLVQALVMLVAAFFILINFVVDLLYAALDPRIRYR